MDAVAVVRESQLDNWTPATSFQRRSINKVSATAEAKKKDAAAVAGAGAGNKATVAEASNMVAEAGAGAGNEATVAGASNLVAEAKKKKKMVRVNQAYIDGILKVYPFKPFPLDPEEIDKTMSDPKKKELLRSMTAEVVATVKAIRAKDEAIIKQYYDKGYAEVETDDDDDEAA